MQFAQHWANLWLPCSALIPDHHTQRPTFAIPTMAGDASYAETKVNVKVRGTLDRLKGSC
jgi:hypothetical protein